MIRRFYGLFSLVFALLFSCLFTALAAAGARHAAPPLDPRISMEVPGASNSPFSAPAMPRVELAGSNGTAMNTRREKAPLLEIGGADQMISDFNYTSQSPHAVHMDIADTGVIFAVARRIDPGLGPLPSLILWRSDDGGTNWQQWQEISNTSSTDYRNPRVLVTRGPNAKVILVYERAELGVPVKIECRTYDITTGSLLGTTIPLSSATIDFRAPSLVADDDSFDSYYVYLVAEAHDTVNGGRVFFTRSTDLVVSWETGYEIGTGTPNSGMHPDISYGFGDWLLVGWTNQPSDFATGSTEVRLRRAASYADAGIAAWEPSQSLTPAVGGDDAFDIQVSASQVSNTVLMTWLRGVYSTTTATVSLLGSSFTSSSDNGASWEPVDSATFGTSALFTRLISVPGVDQWIASGITGVADRRVKIWRAAGTPVPSWNASQEMGDVPGTAFLDGNGLALDPVHSNQIAITSTYNPPTGTSIEGLFFDAEWRSDPGYPVQDPGFPVAVTADPTKTSLLANIDDDPQSEILFGDVNGTVWAYNHDGTPVPGWPVTTSNYVLNLAVTDLTGDGVPAIVASTTAGEVFAFSPDGRTQPGWPITIEQGQNAFVSLGRVGPFHPHDVVVTAGTTLAVYDYQARLLQQWPPFDGAAPYAGSPAIGDIDNDGTTELVAFTNTAIGIAAVGNPTYERTISGFSGEIITEHISLADLDLSGDLEMIVPVSSGTIHVLHPNGSEMAGWPWSVGAGSITTVAVANIAGNSVPELAFSEGESLHLMATNQIEQLGYPKLLGNGFLLGAPTMGRVEGVSNDVAVAARNPLAIHASSNLGAIVPGWPHVMTGLTITPMFGDIDLDGNNEIVAVTNTQIEVLDTNTASELDPSRRWPMRGYDARRTYCLNCPEDMATAVPGEPRLTRVSFASPAPNPSLGRVAFQFALPRHSLIQLDVFDARGRRMRSVARNEADAGVHEVFFDGRDTAGHALASGRYFARLRVRGPGLDQTLTRKFTVLK